MERPHLSRLPCYSIDKRSAACMSTRPRPWARISSIMMKHMCLPRAMAGAAHPDPHKMIVARTRLDIRVKCL